MITNGQTDLLELIQGASEASEGLVRMDAVRRLKKHSLQRLDALALSEFARKAEDPAWRTTAAQVLGFHRVAVQYPDLVEPLKGAATIEQDPDARRALVYAVRDTDGAAELVEHPLPDVALEAVSGVPTSECAWRVVLDGFFAGLMPDLEARVLRLIGGSDESARWVMDYLLQSKFEGVAGDPTDRAAMLIQSIEQGPAFVTLMDAEDGLERTHQQIWPGLARRERKRVLLELFSHAVCEVGLRTSLAEALAEKAQSQKSYIRTHGRILRALLRGLSERDGEQLILVVAHVFDEATAEKKSRLAELMMMVGKELPNTAETVGKILSDWKDAPQEMLLKIRQARMGIR
jgi:hypothetical protein